jgi:hypothetical protein
VNGPKVITALQDETMDGTHDASKPVKTILKGTKMTVIGAYGDYIHISWLNAKAKTTDTGYVWNHLISSNDGVWTINGTGATIHSGPATAAPGIVLLPAKTVVKILDVYATWYNVEIRSNGKIWANGWVYAPYNK